LRANKARDFAIWKEGAQLIHHISLRKRKKVGNAWKAKWTKGEEEKYKELSSILMRQRKYVNTELKAPQHLPKREKSVKWCASCQSHLPLSDFYQCRSEYGEGTCKECTKKEVRERGRRKNERRGAKVRPHLWKD